MDAIMRIGVTASILVALVACTREPAPVTSMSNLVFLTRGGCVNTTTMRANLDEALKTMGLPNDYQFIDLDTLPADDARTGYPTPTVLYANRDLFGMTVPAPPYPEPT
jgi:hypothetical protein